MSSASSDCSNNAEQNEVNEAEQELERVELQHKGEEEQNNGLDEKPQDKNNNEELQEKEENKEEPLLIKSLNECLFNEFCSGLNYCNFPVLLKSEFTKPEEEHKIQEVLNQFKNLNIDVQDQVYTIGINQSKPEFEQLIHELYKQGVAFELDYSKFVSHPGILFIKNMSSCLMFDEGVDSMTFVAGSPEASNNKLFNFLMENCYFKSVKEVRIFNQENGQNSFAIVKFDNYLDVDILIEDFNKHTPNSFNTNPTVPMFLNRYLNRRERFTPNSSLIQNNNVNSNHNNLANNYTPIKSLNQENFNLIVVENLSNFLPADFSSAEFYQLLSKFKCFGNVIEMIYFPIMDCCKDKWLKEENFANKEDVQLKCFDYGFIKFKTNPNVMENTLRILYYLNKLTWEEFITFDTFNLCPLLSEGEDDQIHEEEEDVKSKGNFVQITIAQHKHNHYLYTNANNFYLSTGKNSMVSISYPNPMYILNQYSRNLNYQETNIYVNNLPVVFNNDDEVWEQFWKQFGDIKSAKIIKPQFYHQEEEQASRSGKIGFIFYKTFKQAIRAVLMTNNRVVNIDKFNPILIQSSFAIQKSKSNNGKGGEVLMLPNTTPLALQNYLLPKHPPNSGANGVMQGQVQISNSAPPGRVPRHHSHSQHQNPEQYYNTYATYQQMMPYAYYGYPNPYMVCPPY
ncbi:hypothetical protein JA1_003206 [Spathaspora sp. JA1]|nr:hypothetical protein JA1_003206 [Spathaspora sp. JA1]